MTKRRHVRQDRALAYLRSLGVLGSATAFEIGAFVIRPEPGARRAGWKAKEQLGLSIALALKRQGLIKFTRKGFRIV